MGSISKALAHRLLGLSQVILSNLESGKLNDAKYGLLRMSAVIVTESDRDSNVEYHPIPPRL